MPFYQYRDSHVKDKTVSPTVLSLTWESPYMGKTVFILRRGPEWWCYDIHVFHIILPLSPPVTDGFTSQKTSNMEIWFNLIVILNIVFLNMLLKKSRIVGDLRNHGVHVTSLQWRPLCLFPVGYIMIRYEWIKSGRGIKWFVSDMW